MKEKIKFDFITLIAIGIVHFYLNTWKLCNWYSAFLFEYMEITTTRHVFLVIAVRFPVS